MIKFLCRLVVRLLFRIRLSGRLPESLPERLIVIANHQSFLDGLLIEAFVPFRMTWLVWSGAMDRWYFRMAVRLAPHVLVDPANPLAMKAVIHLIEAGNPVAVFPEGRITVTGSLMKIYEGPAFLAAKTSADLLPVALDGAVHSYFSRMRAPFPRKLRPPVTLTFLPLRQIPMPEARTGKQRRRLASESMRRLLEEMLFLARPRETLFEAFLDAVALNGRRARVLLDFRQKEQSYGQILKAALALGRLVSRLAPETAVVGVLMPNAGSTLALLLGMFAMRRIPAMLNYTAGVEGLESALRLAGIETILTSRSFLERAQLADKVARLENVRVVCLEDLRPSFGLADKLWLLGWALRRPRAVMRPTRPEEPAVVLFTSGSEGAPKGVVLSHHSIMANLAQLKAIFEFSNSDRFLMALPMFHAFGLTVGVMLPVVSGAWLFLYPSPLHYRTIPERAYDSDCTVLFGTNTFLANYGKFAHPYDFYRTRYVIAGAEKLSEEVRTLWMDKFGIRVLEGYGVTECAPVIAGNTPTAYRAGSVGRLLPGIEYRLEPVPGLERGGALHVRGPNLMLGYLLGKGPGVLQTPSSLFGEGWYDTGDMVEIDEQGYLFVIDRRRRFAKVAGEMVSLEAAEKIAAAAAPAFAHAATAVAHAARGETIVLFTEDPNLRRDDLQAAARRRGWPELAVARRIEYRKQIPRLGSGKFDYLALKKLAESEQVAVRVDRAT